MNDQIYVAYDDRNPQEQLLSLSLGTITSASTGWSNSCASGVATPGEWTPVSQRMAWDRSNGHLITVGEHYLVALEGGWPLVPITDIEILNGSSDTPTNGWIQVKVPLQYDADGERAKFAVCVHNRYDVYVIGGVHQRGGRMQSMIRCRFTPQSLTSMTTQPLIDSDLVWERLCPLPVSLRYITAVSVRAGIIVAGKVVDHPTLPKYRRDEETGEKMDVSFTSLYLYRTDTNEWSPLGTPKETEAIAKLASTVIIDPYLGDEFLVLVAGQGGWTINITATIASTNSVPTSTSSSWIRLPSQQRSSASFALVPFETI